MVHERYNALSVAIMIVENAHNITLCYYTCNTKASLGQYIIMYIHILLKLKESLIYTRCTGMYYKAHVQPHMSIYAP